MLTAATAAALAAGLLSGGSAAALNTLATVPVGAFPRGVAFAPDGSSLYATSGNGLTVISAADNSITATVPVGTNLGEPVVTPDGGRIYVADPGNNEVDVVNAATRTAVASIPVADGPYGLAVTPAGNTVLVTRRGTDKVSLISTATNTVTGQVTVGNGPTDVAVSADGTRAVVVNGGAGTISVITLSGPTVAATVPVGATPYGVAMDPVNGTAYISSFGANTVSLLTTGNVISRTIPVAGGPVAAGRSRDGTVLYVAEYGGSQLATVRLSTSTVSAEVPTGTQPISVAVSPDGSRVATANFISGDVTVMAAAPRAATAAATAVKGEKATGNGAVTADAGGAVGSVRCYYGEDEQQVRQGPGGGAAGVPAAPGTVAANTSALVTCSFTNLDRGRVYHYVVAATDADGTGWAPETQSFVTRPPKIASPTVKRKKRKLVLTWSATRSADQYEARIRKNGSWRAWRIVGTPKVSFHSLARGTSYRIQVKAGNESGFGPTRSVTTSTR